MHVCVVLAIFVCWCHSSRTLLCFFSPRMICCDCVSVCACVQFFCLALRDVCVAHERLVLVDAEHAHTILHLSFTGRGTF